MIARIHESIMDAAMDWKDAGLEWEEGYYRGVFVGNLNTLVMVMGEAGYESEKIFRINDEYLALILPGGVELG